MKSYTAEFAKCDLSYKRKPLSALLNSLMFFVCIPLLAKQASAAPNHSVFAKQQFLAAAVTSDNSTVLSGAIATAPTSQQQAQIHKKLQGTWKSSSLKAPQNSTRIIFLSPQQSESFSYQFGKLSFRYKMKHQIMSVRNVNSSQLITIKFIDVSSSSQRNEPIEVILEFQGDRQFKMDLMDNYNKNQGFSPDTIVINKISNNTSTTVIEKIPFKATNNEAAQDEALNNLYIVLNAQETYRAKNPKFATDFMQLKNAEDLRDGNTFYSYRMTNANQKWTTVRAVPKKKKLLSAVGLIYANPDGKTTNITICKSDKPTMKVLGEPIVKTNESGVVVLCPSGSRKFILIISSSWR
jgi:Type IV pilin-like G and H, putative